MDPIYHIADSHEIPSPAMIVYQQLLEGNLDTMIRIAGDASRLRPHCKTHKMAEVVALQLHRGILRHKAATFAEAEMLARAGARDVFLAYNLVGPNVQRAVAFLRLFPHVRFAVTADDEATVQRMSEACAAAGVELGVLLDLDTGQHRTGLAAGERAMALYADVHHAPGLRADGIHLYDGQNHQSDVEERRQAVLAGWKQAATLRDRLEAKGLPVPQIVAGGTGSFPIFATLEDPALQLSPGTCVFHDAGYSERFPDLPFRPAALLLTRVISRPTPDRITLDLGYKAVASDPAVAQRVIFPELPDARIVLQNEEHLVLETAAANDYRPGDELLGVPRHVCPTSALHRQVYVVRDGRLAGCWDVTARDRCLTI